MSPEESYGRSMWLSWTDRKLDLITSAQFVKAQPYRIDPALLAQLQNASAFRRGFDIASSNGLATVLVHGGFKSFPEEQFAALKKRITKLYGLRSKALHGAAHNHVFGQNIADLNQWVAWMIINMIVFVERGYTTRAQIRASIDP